MFRSTEKANSLRARVVELEESFKTDASKVWDIRRTAEIKVVAEQAITEIAEQTAWIIELEDESHKLKGKLELLERRKSVASYCTSLLADEYYLQRHQIASCRVCSGEIEKRLSNAIKDVNASIDDLNLLAANVQKSEQDTFYGKFVSLAKHHGMFFKQEVSLFSKFVDESACNADSFLHGNFAHCRTTGRECLEWFAGQGIFNGGLGSFWGGSFPESVDRDYRSYDIVVVRI